jgi:Rad3-related DNA helicase
MIKYFPLDLKPRKQQIDALNFCKTSIKDGKKYMMLNIPTGGGKSYFVIMFANWYKNMINKNAKFDIITNSKLLQDQYINDFSFIRNLKGKSNYYCSFHGTSCLEGKELNKILKRKCNHCPYDLSKKKWINSDISMSNFALYISMILYTDNINRRKTNVLIVDESHDFENVFCDLISITINKHIFKSCGFKQTIYNKYLVKLKKIKSQKTFIEFLQNVFINDLESLNDSQKENINRNNIIKKQWVYSTNLLERIEKLIIAYNNNNDNWTVDLSNIDNSPSVQIQPIWGNVFLKDIWKKYDHIIFMSGTILNKNMFSFINGINSEQSNYIEMDSVFDKSKRPLYYIQVGKMTYSDKKNTFNKQIGVINKILKKYKDKKGIIHTYNYELSNWIKDRIKDDRLMFHDSKNREVVYRKFIKSPLPSIIVSPSMMTGIDLKGDLARFSIILKMPYPNISSNKIKSKQQSNQNWYSFYTISTLIQMYGRTIRSIDDYSDTFILDSSFSNLIKYNSNYIPKYITNAIKLINFN